MAISSLSSLFYPVSDPFFHYMRILRAGVINLVATALARVFATAPPAEIKNVGTSASWGSVMRPCSKSAMVCSIVSQRASAALCHFTFTMRLHCRPP